MEAEDPLAPYFFKREEMKIRGHTVSSIVDDYLEDRPNVIDRFFTRYYYLKRDANRTPYKVLFHTNRICLVCLAPEHPALAEGIAGISFNVGNVDRSKNAVKGKGKKGGMNLQADTTLALLTTAQGRTFSIPSCIRGKLIEVNTELAEQPKRLQDCAEGEGYLAIILPKLEQCDELKAQLMTEEQYSEYKEQQASAIRANEPATTA